MPDQGEFGREWWSRRWLDALERAGWADRLQRGRSYARAGRVAELKVEAGRLSARVQGSSRSPYQVEVNMLPLGPSTWRAVTAALSQRAADVAQLLAGRMPDGIEEAFLDCGTLLFPDELVAECSCPDWAVPCKHIAALCYAFGTHLDDDPFLLFQLRGRSRQEFLSGLERTASEGAAPPAGRGREQRPDLVSVAAFWSPGRIDSPATDGPALGLPASLPEPDWWHGKRSLTDLLGRVYDAVAAACEALGDW